MSNMKIVEHLDTTYSWSSEYRLVGPETAVRATLLESNAGAIALSGIDADRSYYINEYLGSGASNLEHETIEALLYPDAYTANRRARQQALAQSLSEGRISTEEHNARMKDFYKAHFLEPTDWVDSNGYASRHVEFNNGQVVRHPMTWEDGAYIKDEFDKQGVDVEAVLDDVVGDARVRVYDAYKLTDSEATQKGTTVFTLYDKRLEPKVTFLQDLPEPDGDYRGLVRPPVDVFSRFGDAIISPMGISPVRPGLDSSPA